MNSISKPSDHSDCDCKRPTEVANVLLKCKTGCNITVPVTTNGDIANGGTNVGTTLVSLTINTKKFKDPCFKFDFAANIIGTDNTTASFQIYKLCKGDRKPTEFGPAWALSHRVNEIISFFVCDCDCDCDCDKDDCCTYTVVVTVDGQNPLNVNNPTLSALVVEKNCRCK
jgi:hypothetical protein